MTNNGVTTTDLAYAEILWKLADALRGQIDAAEYKHVVLGLLFLKYISHSFEARRDEVGRPKGALGTSRLDGKEQDIRELLGKDVSKASIAKILDVSRSALYHFIQTRKIAPG